MCNNPIIVKFQVTDKVVFVKVYYHLNPSYVYMKNIPREVYDTCRVDLIEDCINSFLEN